MKMKRGLLLSVLKHAFSPLFDHKKDKPNIIMISFMKLSLTAQRTTY